MEKTIISGLMEFIDNSSSVFHVIDNIKKELLQKNFCELCEGEDWQIKSGGNYFVTRNMSAIIAFKVPETPITGFNIVASHSDSPSFKIKQNPEIEVGGQYISLNTECYGGMIMSTWLDRPLSIAGRAIVKNKNEIVAKLVKLDSDLLIIPSVAIHMDRDANDGKKLNPQIDLLPLLGDITNKGCLEKMIAENISEKSGDILSTELYLYNCQKSCLCGGKKEYICAPKLDDLQCVYSSLQGFMASSPASAAAVLAVFDNEEVGSGTKQGAASTLLLDTLTRINSAMGNSGDDYLRTLANSFMISADNAHAVHPNHTELCDPTNKPFINKGIVIKYNANQKYTTDGISAAIFKDIAKSCKVEYQSFLNRSNIVGGSTLGNLSSLQVAINTVDIGLPQLAMHSSFETAGVKDSADLFEVCKKFYSVSIKKQGDGLYTVI